MKLAFLAVLLVFLVLPLTYGAAGLGVSDYDSKVLVKGPMDIPLGKVMNTGNESLIFNYVWKQTNSTVNMTLPVMPYYTNYTVQPGQSFEPIIMIGDYNESYAGNYSGIVEITGSYQMAGGGNIVVPGAECHISLIVNDLPGQQKQQDPLYLVVIIVCVFGILSGIGTYYYVGTRKLRRKL